MSARDHAASEPPPGVGETLARGLDGLMDNLADGLSVATLLVDEGGRITFFDRPAERLTGHRAADVIGRTLSTVVHSGALPAEDWADDRTCAGHDGVIVLRRADGAGRTVIGRWRLVRPTDGAAVRLVQFIDLGAAGEILSRLGHLDLFFHQAPIGFTVLDEDLRYVMLNQALADYNDRSIADHIGRRVRDVLVSPDIEAYERMLRKVLRDGDPVLNISVPRSPTTRPDQGGFATASWFRITGRRGEPLGLCGLVGDDSPGRRRSLADTRARRLSTLLSRAGALLASSLEMKTVARRITELLTEDFCDLAAIDVYREVVGGDPAPAGTETAVLHRLAAATRIHDPLAHLLAGREGPRPLESSPGLAAVLRDDRSRMFPPDDFADTGVPEALQAAARELGASSYLAVPLRARGTTIGALSCLRTGDRAAFAEDDLRFAESLAERAAATIDNTRRFREEREKALLLQMSLLPGRLPSLPEAALEYRYLPGKAGQEVGGDWYDAIVLPGHRIALVIGDVAGHGIAAAATMGRYRSVVQTLASIGLEPGALLTRLNQIAGTFGETAMATCVYLHYDPWNQSCIMASAGHLPPIIARPGEPARTVDVAHGPMLGATSNALYETHAVDAPPGTRILLYTDGLVESRSVPFESGIARLTALADEPHLELAERADVIMAAAPPDSHDDRALLLADLRGMVPKRP